MVAMPHNGKALLAGIEFKKLKLKQMTKKELLYNKLGALRLEVDSSIVDDIVAAANDALQEQYLQQCNVSGSLPLPTKSDASTYANGAFGYDADSYDKESAFMSGYQWTIDWICSKSGGNDR